MPPHSSRTIIMSQPAMTSGRRLDEAPSAGKVRTGRRLQNRSSSLRMRKELDLFCNLRPVRTLPALGASSSLRPEVIAGCDMMIVRELCGGIYFAKPRGRETIGD